MDDTDLENPPMGVSGSVRALVLDPDRYAIGEVLGEGGMGEVRRCRDTSAGRDVALKAIRAHVDVDDVEVRFLREARVQARLAHPAVVPVYDVGRDSHGRAYFTMKRVEGVTLDDVVNLLRENEQRDGDAVQHTHHAYGLHRLLSAFSRVCLAVDFAHARGVLHRDLKPANVMLGAFGEVYVLDWGLAKIGPGEESHGGTGSKPQNLFDNDVDDSARTIPLSSGSVPIMAAAVPVPSDGNTERGIAMGTPAYMAPEQAAARPLDARADVFSLGAILFEILTLEQLRSEADIVAARARKLVAIEARPSVRAPHLEIPEELDAICVRATEHDPANRFQSARALHEAVEAFLAADEDQGRRQRLATTHVRHARALSTPEAGDERRPEALEQLGAALALAPEDVEARKYLVHLLKTPPTKTPEEVKERRTQHEVARMRRMQRVSATIHASVWLVGYPLIVLAGGIKNLLAALIVPATWLITSVLTLTLFRWKQYDARISWSGLTSSIALAATSLIWGPLFIMPGLAVALVFGHILVATKRQRTQTVVFVCLALAIPAYLAFRGTLDVYTPIGMRDGFIIHGAIGSARNVFYGGLLLCHLAQMIFGARFAARYRDVLDARVLENALFSWQLSNLVPRADLEKRGAGTSTRPSFAVIEDEAVGVASGGASGMLEPSIPPPTHADASITGDARYAQMERLLETSVSEVWRCNDRRLGREVEMHISKTPEYDDAVRMRACMRGRLEHPSVAPLYDVGVMANSRAFFTAKYVRGVPFNRAISALGRGLTRERSRRRLLAALGQVCLAIAYAHDRNVSHGAISTSSIFLGSFGEVYVEGWTGRKGNYASCTADIAALGEVLRDVLDMHGAVAPELDAVCARVKVLGPAGPTHTMPLGHDPNHGLSARMISEAIDAFLSGDRDAEVRRELAHTHLARAHVAAEHAFGGRGAFEAQANARVEALREIGRAVRLEPEDPEAIRLLFRLLTEPPSQPPPEVLQEVERARQARARGPALAALLFGGLWLVLYPFVALLLGVRQVVLVLIVWICWALAEAAMALAIARPGGFAVGGPNLKTKSGAPVIPWPMIAMMLAGMSTAALSGPFFVTPVIATVSAMCFVLVVTPPWRYVTLALGSIVVIVPTVLAWTRLFPTIDMIGDIVISNGAFESPSHATTYLVLTVVHLLAVLFAAEYAARFRERLDVVETAFLVRTWQLTKLLPQRPTTNGGVTTTLQLHGTGAAARTTSSLRRRHKG